MPMFTAQFTAAFFRFREQWNVYDMAKMLARSDCGPARANPQAWWLKKGLLPEGSSPEMP